jgi:hypothetical protein
VDLSAGVETVVSGAGYFAACDLIHSIVLDGDKGASGDGSDAASRRPMSTCSELRRDGGHELACEVVHEFGGRT